MKLEPSTILKHIVISTFIISTIFITGCTSSKTAPVIKTYKEYLPLISIEQEECLDAAKDLSGQCYQRAELEIDLCKEEAKLSANDQYRDVMIAYTKELEQMQLNQQTLLANLKNSLATVDGLYKRCSNLSTLSAKESVRPIYMVIPNSYTNKKQKVTCSNAFYTKQDIQTAISNNRYGIYKRKPQLNDFINYSSCNAISKRCKYEYDANYQACGGKIIINKRCFLNCGESK